MSANSARIARWGSRTSALGVVLCVLGCNPAPHNPAPHNPAPQNPAPRGSLPTQEPTPALSSTGAPPLAPPPNVSAAPSALTLPSPAPDPEPEGPLIEGMRSRIARGDAYFPDLDNGCTDAHGYITPPLWDESRVAMLLPSHLAERRVKQLARQVVTALAHDNYAFVAKQVDSVHGLCMRASKGGSCVWLTQAEVRDCRKFFSNDWDIDSGQDGPWPGTCHDKMKSVFMVQDFTRATSASFNCFSGLRGNNGSSTIQPDMSTTAFAEFFFMPAGEFDGMNWHALRLGYTTDGQAPKLVEMISEYWGI